MGRAEVCFRALPCNLVKVLARREVAAAQVYEVVLLIHCPDRIPHLSVKSNPPKCLVRATF